MRLSGYGGGDVNLHMPFAKKSDRFRVLDTCHRDSFCGKLKCSTFPYTIR